MTLFDVLFIAAIASGYFNLPLTFGLWAFFKLAKVIVITFARMGDKR